MILFSSHMVLDGFHVILDIFHMILHGFHMIPYGFHNFFEFPCKMFLVIFGRFWIIFDICDPGILISESGGTFCAHMGFWRSWDFL